MAANTHQYRMKRTSVSGRLANTTDSSNTSYIPAGALAVNFADQTVYTSDGTNLIQVGSNVTNLNVTSTLTVNGASINATSFSGTANNALNLAGQPASYYTNATNITTGTLNPARLALSGVVANTYGNASSIPVITVDSAGRVTTVSTSAVAGVTGFNYYSANSTITLTTGDGSSYTATINQANSTVSGLVEIVDSTSNTSSTVAASANAVHVAYIASQNAYSNSISYITSGITNGSIVTANAVYSQNSGALGGKSLTTVESEITSNAATAYANSTSYTDGKIATVNSAITGNSSTAYTNAVNYVANGITNGSIVAANATYSSNSGQLSGTSLSTLQSQITSNASAAYSNAVNYVANGVANGSIVVANATYAANAGLLGGVSLTTLQNQITGNAATSYSNAVVNAAYVAGVAYANAVAFAANASNITKGTLPYAQLPANVVIWSNNNIFSGIETFNANVSLASGNGTNQLLINTINATSSGLLANSTVLTLGNSSVNVVVNATSFSGTSNNSLNLGGATLSTIQTQITGNSATAYSNAVSNTTYQVGVAYTNAVANTTYQSGVAYANAVSNATYQASTAYANAVAIAATDATSKAGIAYSNATSFASNATNITSGTLSATRLPYTLNQNVGSSDSPNFLNLTLAGNLSVGGSVTTISANNLAITDNMLYLNNGVLANVTGLTANGSTVVFAANNNFAPTWSVTTLSITPASYNNTYTITAANSTTFTVASTVTDAFVSGGTARGKSSANPDIGFAAGYNDGTYHHTGFFRDHATGVWKVFDGYLPEPDNSVYIDQTNSSFNVANFMAGTLYAGNNSVSATVNSTFYSATANNANNFAGQSLTTVQSWITGNASIAYSNAVANAAYQAGVAYSNAIAVAASDATSKAATAYANAIANAASNAAGIYQTTAGLSANVATLTSNNSTNFGGLSLTTVQSQITGNAATAFANAIANAASNAAGIYQTTAGLLANVATLTSNNSTNFGGLSLTTIQSQITGNAATAYSNAVANAAALYQTTAGLSGNVLTLTANNTNFVGTISAANVVSNSQLQSNLSNYQTTAGLAANVATLAANSATYLGNSSGTIANIASWVTGNSAAAYTNAITFAANASTINSGSIGVSYLPANIVFWSNTNTFTANQTFSANVTTANIYSSGTVNAASYAVGTSFVANTTQLTITTPVSANGSTGTAGYVLTTNGATGSPYWAVASAGVNTANQYVWSNTQTFSANVVINGVLQSGVVTINAVSNATITPVASNTNHNNIYNINATPTINQPSGAPYADAQKLMLRLKDSGTANSLTWNVSPGSNSSTTAGFRSMATSNVALPSTTIAGKVTYVACVYNALDFYWDVVGVSNQ